MTWGRRVLTVAFVAGLVFMPCALGAQPTGRPPRIGLLVWGPAAVEWLRDGLRDLGYTEGHDVIFEVRVSKGPGDLPDLAAQLIGLRVDVIFAPTTPDALAAQKATRTIPIVFAGAGDPVGTGLVTSLARPGANVTGVTSMTRDLEAKRLQILTEALPGLKQVGVVWRPSGPLLAVQRRMLSDLETAAQTLKLKVRIAEWTDTTDLDRTLSGLVGLGVGAVIAQPHVELFRERSRLAAAATRHRLPVLADSREYAEAGVLLTYGAKYSEIVRQAATHVVKVLRGARPADLPVEQPTKFDLVVNLRTAKTLGLTLPSGLLSRAESVIE
jgi:putative ABC transport system substrate-binding protein